MYSEKVMDHFQNPRNVGEIENASGVGTVGNAKCGDIMRIYLDIDDKGVIKDCKFKTFGCGAAVATSSMAMAKLALVILVAAFLAGSDTTKGDCEYQLKVKTEYKTIFGGTSSTL